MFFRIYKPTQGQYKNIVENALNGPYLDKLDKKGNNVQWTVSLIIIFHQIFEHMTMR